MGGGALFGGLTAAANEVHEQTLKGKTIKDLDMAKIGKTAVIGAAVGGLAGKLEKAGDLIGDFQVIGKELGQPLSTFGPEAGTIGNVAGTLAANSLSDSNSESLGGGGYAGAGTYGGGGIGDTGRDHDNGGYR